MTSVRRVAGFLAMTAILVAAAPAMSAAPDALRAEFDAIMQGLDGNSFDRFNRAIDEAELTRRIFGTRMIDADIKRSFARDFDASVNGFFTASFPESKTDILATVVSFDTQGGQGRAVVRYSASGYRYSYHVYELALDSKGKLSILDWVDYYGGGRFSDQAGAALVMAMPGKPATRNLLQQGDLPDREVFQVSELLKAYRDNNNPRFFQIYDELDPELRRNKVLARLHFDIAMEARDRARIAGAANGLQADFPDDASLSLRLMEFYIAAQRYPEAIAALVLLEQDLGVSDGAIESLKAMAALADGNLEDAERYAVRATELEPSLEVAWWSLLRVRTRAADYAGTTVALSRLEDDFGENLDAPTLARDRFLKVLADQPEYLAWRASRD